jgi:hypothetical protein
LAHVVISSCGFLIKKINADERQIYSVKEYLIFAEADLKITWWHHCK